jgi:nitrile hydratase accessory protein
VTFEEPWQAQAFVLAVALSERGLFTWSEWARAFAAEAGGGYYDRWLAALERLVCERGLVAADALGAHREAWAHAAARTPHGTPIELSAADFSR